MYKTLYLKENPDFEYQKRGKNWFKRNKLRLKTLRDMKVAKLIFMQLMKTVKLF